MLTYYAATYQPGSPVEADLVDEMVACRWRMQRLRMIETALMDSEMDRELPESETSDDPGYQMAFAFRRLVDESRAISLASRYESRLHRMHERSHRTLRDLQQSRKEEAGLVGQVPDLPSPDPGPNPVVEDEPTSESKKLRNEPEPLTPAAVKRLPLVAHRASHSWGGRSCRLPHSVTA